MKISGCVLKIVNNNSRIPQISQVYHRKKTAVLYRSLTQH